MQREEFTALQEVMMGQGGLETNARRFPDRGPSSIQVEGGGKREKGEGRQDRASPLRSVCMYAANKHRLLHTLRGAGTPLPRILAGQDSRRLRHGVSARC
jgi:hypothetical protein